MNGISRYILRQLGIGTILITLALTCVIWLSQSLRFIEMIVNRGLTTGKFVYLTMLLLPNFLSIILPIALFTAIVFVYNKLNSDRELIVMRSVGLSPVALARPALILTGIVVLIQYALNLYFLPVSYQMFRELQWDIRYNYSHILLQEGAFNTVSPGVTVYVRERSAGGELKSILVHDTRDKDKPMTIMAARGALINADGEARVMMFDGNRQQVDRGTNRLSILYFDRYTFDMDNRPQEVLQRFREPRERMIDELFNADDGSIGNPNDVGKFLMEGHKRLLSPIMALTFALVGLTSLLTAGFENRGQLRPILMAVGIVTVIEVAALGFENVGARDLRLVPLMYIAIILPACIAGYLLARPPSHRPPSAAPVDPLQAAS